MFMMHTPSCGCIYILISGITQCTDIDHHRLRRKVKIAEAYKAGNITWIGIECKSWTKDMHTYANQTHDS